MKIARKTTEEYQGFEQIHPSAQSTLQPPCPSDPKLSLESLYVLPGLQGFPISIRPKDHVIKDIDSVYRSVQVIQKTAPGGGKVPPAEFEKLPGMMTIRTPGFPDAPKLGFRWNALGVLQEYKQPDYQSFRQPG